MPDAVYDVQANIVLDANRALRQSVKLNSRMMELGRRIKGVNSASNRMLRNMVLVGASYVGIRLLGGAIRSATRHTIGFSAELEKTRIGLGAVLAAVEGTTFEEGMKRGSKVFRELTEDAIKSTSTTMEMFRIYQNILGPIRAAGFGLEVVREVTNSTVAAASALNVDFAQAQRDIQLMVQGTAGMDTRLFAILRSTGAIVEDTEQWNKNLTAQDRVEKLRVALAKFSPAADAYAKSWAGITSTFGDITEQLMAVAAGPAFEAIKKFIDGINERMIQNREQLEIFLTRVGAVLGDKLGNMFAQLNRGISYMILNWDTISARISKTVQMVREMTPMLVKAAAAYAAISVGRTVVGGAVMGAGAVVKGAEMIAAPALAGAMAGAAAVGGFVKDPAAIKTAGLGLGAGWMSGAGTGGGAVAAGGAGTAAAAGTVSLGLALGVFAAALAAVAGVVLVVQEQWETLTQIFEKSTDGLGAAFMGLVKAIGAALMPVLKIVGHFIAVPLTAAFVALVPILHTIIEAMRVYFSGIAAVVNIIYYSVKPAFDAVYTFFSNLAGHIRNFLIAVGVIDKGPGAKPMTAEQRLAMIDKKMGLEPGQDFMAQLAAQVKTGGFGGRKFGFETGEFGGVPKGRQKVINDFRGSKIQVKQTFREADPDRVAIQMMEDIHKQAEMRLRSGFAPALSG